jgi:hypothetical protein
MGTRKIRKRKSSKKKTRKHSDAYNVVPSEIHTLMSERHILNSEDPRAYDKVFTSLMGMFEPENVRHWLLLKDLQDTIWEKRRMQRIKPSIIDSAQMSVVTSILQSLPLDLKMKLDPAVTSVVTWFIPGKNKELLEGLLECFNYSKTAIEGMAFVDRMPEMETLDKLQLVNEARQEAIYRLLADEQTARQLPKPANDDATESARLADGRTEDNGSGDGNEVQSEEEGEKTPTQEAPDVVHDDEVSSDVAEETGDDECDQTGGEETNESEEEAA